MGTSEKSDWQKRVPLRQRGQSCLRDKSRNQGTGGGKVDPYVVQIKIQGKRTTRKRVSGNKKPVHNAQEVGQGE